LAAFESVRQRLPVTQQAVRQGLLQAALPGRFQILPGQPTVILDVAHNPHAAAVLEKNLGNMGFHPYTYAVFGMLADKDIKRVVAHLSKRVDKWFCASLPGARGVTSSDLQETVRQVLEDHSAELDPMPSTEGFDDPVSAYEAACHAANPDDRIIVFGSFLTVSAVLANLRKH